ncbi:MAG TPA: YggS family pyridoxal phosphate-dependent enzyme [Streptosporangiaceae bacterium]
MSTAAGEPAGGAASRRAELAASLQALRGRIAAACAAAGRPSGEVTLIAVTKTFPVSDIELLADLGVLDIGENKDQEAAPKAARCAADDVPVTWHFVGSVQVNKAASVSSYAHVVHSVDRLRLVLALGRRASAAGRTVTCLVQVSLDGDPGRGGAAIGEVPAVAEAIAGQDGLLLGGVMAIAPQPMPPASAFGRLREVAEQVRSAYPAATMISAGMSGDLEEAIAKGATHVRVGTALLGGRRPFVR